MEVYRTILFSFLYLFPIFTISTATDTLNISKSITDDQTLVSADGVFELGFFSPGNSTNRYIGIWYKKLTNPTKQFVWVANREDPIVTSSSSAVLTVRNPGILVLLDHNETIIWSSNRSRSAANPVAQLLDSGNLVVRDASDDDPENYLWQSFDYPCDTLLPGMKHGKNLVTGLDRYLSSWKSPNDPAKGNFAYRIESNGYPQLVMRKGSAVYFRGGPWNGIRFSGTPYLKPNSLYTYEFVLNEKEYYYKYQLINTSVVTMLGLTYQGIYQRFIWIEKTQAWNVYLSGQTEPCDTYALCGPFGICNIGNSPGCACLKGYEPKFQEEWSRGNQTSGCVRRKALDCRGGDKFMKYSGVKLPNTRNSWFNVSMSLEECRMVCLKNCSCTAYATLDILKGSGCLLWLGDLIDIRVFEENGQEIYVRVASSEIGGSNGKKRVIIIVSLVLLAGILLGVGLALCIRKKKKKQPSRQGKYQHNLEKNYTSESQNDDLELPLFDLASVAKATNNFSVNNKIGEGGFGPVYKGKLQGGQEIAVKRLSIDSKQGVDEFKNEVLCIAKLQHRNLVKLLGCCLEEKMLIYEYMPNKSLDIFIFDQTKSKLLNWEKRINIINGIARGLLYLHQDSRLRIIHRDLKASNILLDHELNAKISDFGMAKSFGGNETEANTTRVVGTYGYMSPEYAIDGLFSVKSDVFSFGVLVLEIVSGHKNRGFHHSDHDLNLIGHAWVLYLEGRPLELIDETMGDSCNLSEAIRLIHVGLLCVQQHPEDRPTMSAAVLMLGSDSELPPPKQPGFFTDRNPREDDYSSGKQDTRSINEMSVTLLTAR